MHTRDSRTSEPDAWNPGISSSIPSALEPMITLFLPGNSTVDFKNATELSDFCGLNSAELMVFTLERLVTHELLVRVTSDLSVPDGPNYEDLGINLRSMVAVIFEHHVAPELDRMHATYDDRITRAREYIQQQVEQRLFDSSKKPTSAPSLLERFVGIKQRSANKRSPSMADPVELTALAYWREQVSSENHINTHCLSALIKVVDSIVSQRGRVVNDPDLIVKIVCGVASNNIGAELVTELLEPIFLSATKKEGYRILPLQEKPVVMNVKGASASGKSTIRPKQRQLADKLGIAWQDFAVISPDYWRKYLLDYESLGEDYKYAAMLTGQELAIIDKKLDRYMADKAKRHEIPHLLIDRFRFDSFSVKNGHSQDSRLLSRFGDRIYMFFMITAPSETVVRAWERGITTGRYKAVDDLLYHNIEAFTGMPELFFSWVLSNDKRVRFEFLDNNVPKGEIPGTIAFGCNNSLTILDLEALCNIDRYRQVNIHASGEGEVLTATDNNSSGGFVARCIAKIARVQVVDAATGEVCALFVKGELIYLKPDGLAACGDTSGMALAEALADELPHLVAGSPVSLPATIDAADTQIDIVAEQQDTLGRWNYRQSNGNSSVTL